MTRSTQQTARSLICAGIPNNLAMFLYIHPESSSAFLSVEPIDQNKSIDAAHCELVCEVPDQQAPKNQAEFEELSQAMGITNANEFRFSVVPHFPESEADSKSEGGAAGVLQGSVEAAAALPSSEPKATKTKRVASQLVTVEAPTDMAAQTIVKLSVSNVKRISAVEITPDGAVIIVGGVNGAGKSSVLDAIQMAFGGKDTFPEKPIRDGKKGAKIVCETEDLIVTRAVTPSGGTLTVSPKSDAKSKFSSPQQLLDRLTGKLTFDPLAFLRLDTKAQLNTLKQLVGLDFAAEDTDRASLYADRTLKGRELQQAQALLSSTVLHADVPPDEQSVADLSEKLLEVQSWNQKRSAIVAKVDGYAATIQSSNQRINALNLQIGELMKQRSAEERSIDAAKSMKDALEAGLVAMPEKSDEVFRDQLKHIESTNQKVRANRSRHDAEESAQKLNTEYDELTSKIEAIDTAKSTKLAATKFPVPGLSFNETGVLVNGQPFSQASSAEQIRISVAMGLALNPTLKVILIRDGSLLDSKSLSLVSQMAINSGAQVWIEKVSETGEGCSVVIDDGAVKG